MANVANIMTLGARLVFKSDGALLGLNKVSRSFQNLQKKARRLREGLSSIATGMRQIGIAGAAAAIALGFAGKSALNFESAMSGVSAVLITATRDQMGQLTELAKELGRTTVFTATQAAEATEKLARAGFNVAETMSALPAILNAAAAENIDLSTATLIVSQNVRAFNLAATDAAHVADVLALASANTNTTMVGLGESLKFAAPFASRLGISLEETTAAIGLLGDAGLRGTIAGTALKNMLIKLSKPSKDTIALFGGRKGFAAAVLDSSNKLKPLPDLIASLSNVLNANGTILDKAERANKLFGIRGEAAFALLANAGKLVNQEFVTMLRNSSKMRDEFGNEVGAAAIMAKRRLDNLRGAMILFRSALEGFNIELFAPLMKPITRLVIFLTEKLQDLVAVMQILNSPDMELSSDGIRKFGPFIISLAKGLNRAGEMFGKLIDSMRKGLKIMFLISDFFGKTLIEGAAFATMSIIGLTIAFSIFAGTMVGVAVALGGISAIISGVTAILSILSIKLVLISALLIGIATIITGGLFLIALGIFQSFRRKGESLQESLVRAFTTIGTAVENLFLGAIFPFFKGFMKTAVPQIRAGIELIGKSFDILFITARALFRAFGIDIGDAGNMFLFLGKVAGLVFGGIIRIFSTMIAAFVTKLAVLMGMVKSILTSPLFKVAVKLLPGVDTEDFFMKIDSAETDFDKMARDLKAISDIAIEDLEDSKVSEKTGTKKAISDLKDELNITTKTDLCIDRKSVASAVSRTKQDAIERGGGSQTAWQRRQSIEDSVVFTVTR